MDLLDTIKEIVCRYSLLDIKKDEIEETTDLISDLGINSIGIIQIFIELEEKLDIEIDSDFDFNAMSKVSSLYNIAKSIYDTKVM